VAVGWGGYKAEDTRLHRFVALKFLPSEADVPKSKCFMTLETAQHAVYRTADLGTRLHFWHALRFQWSPVNPGNETFFQVGNGVPIDSPSVHLFPHCNHAVVQGVSNVGPATVVLDVAVAPAVPAVERGAKSSEFSVRRSCTRHCRHRIRLLFLVR
jgi:hypothetical protein